MTMMWATTRSGLKWDFLNPDPENVRLTDISEGLALLYRFNGAVGRYSVGEHSCHVFDAACRHPLLRTLPHARFYALMHDAHEAFIGDLITPALHALERIAVIYGDHPGHVLEAMTKLKWLSDRAIFQTFGIDMAQIGIVAASMIKELDTAAMMTERDALMPDQPEDWGELEKADRLDFTPQLWSPERAAWEFEVRAADCLRGAADRDIGGRAVNEQDNAPGLRLLCAVARWRRARRRFFDCPTMANAHRVEQADARVREVRRQVLIVVSNPDPASWLADMADMAEREAAPWTFS